MECPWLKPGGGMGESGIGVRPAPDSRALRQSLDCRLRRRHQLLRLLVGQLALVVLLTGCRHILPIRFKYMERDRKPQRDGGRADVRRAAPGLEKASDACNKRGVEGHGRGMRGSGRFRVEEVFEKPLGHGRRMGRGRPPQHLHWSFRGLPLTIPFPRSLAVAATSTCIVLGSTTTP